MNRVCARESPPFRPTVEQTDCPESLIELMDKCWNDNPDERPSFDSLKVTVRCVMKYVVNFMFFNTKLCPNRIINWKFQRLL